MSFPPFNRGPEYVHVDRDYLNGLRDERDRLRRLLNEAYQALDNRVTGDESPDEAVLMIELERVCSDVTRTTTMRQEE